MERKKSLFSEHFPDPPRTAIEKFLILCGCLSASGANRGGGKQCMCYEEGFSDSWRLQF